MRILRPLALKFAVVLVPFAQSAAQTCLGSNSFTNGRMALGAQASFLDGRQRFGGIFEYGAPKSWYAGVTVGATKDDAQGGLGTPDFGGSLGYQVVLGDSPAEICPFGFAAYSPGGFAGTLDFGFGSSVGWRVAASDAITIVPGAGLQLHGVSRDGVSGSPPKDSHIEFFGNVGIIVNKHWAIVPGVLKSNASGSKPFFQLKSNASGSKAVFMVTLGYFWGQ